MFPGSLKGVIEGITFGSIKIEVRKGDTKSLHHSSSVTLKGHLFSRSPLV